MEKDNDIDLMLRYKKYRDREAFAELVRRYQKPLINFFYRFCWDAALAEDFAQEVFIRLAQNAKRYHPSAKLNTFLYRIAKNIWLDYWRSQKNKPATVSLDNEVNKDDKKETKLVNLIASDQKSSEEILIDKESILKIKENIKSISVEHKMIIDLCVFEGVSYEDAGEILGIPPGTAKSRLHFAILELKEKMKCHV